MDGIVIKSWDKEFVSKWFIFKVYYNELKIEYDEKFSCFVLLSLNLEIKILFCMWEILEKKDNILY